jgi:hypothetical protein
MRPILRLLLAAMLAAIVALTAVSAASSAGAFILKDEELGCFTNPGDIPGMPGFDLPRGIVVITPSGHLALVCHGPLPTGLSVPETMVLTVPCTLGPPFGTTPGLLVVTKSGMVNAYCQAQASG